MAENLVKQQNVPRYTGLVKYVAKRDGYALWLPADWHKMKMRGGHRGVIFSPYADDLNTSFSAYKTKLPFPVTHNDLPALRDGFEHGLSSLPGLEIESEDEIIEKSILAFEARFTFLEGEYRRKRWLRIIYAGNAELVLIAQGRTPEDFEYWMPMFYNTMMTVEL